MNFSPPSMAIADSGFCLALSNRQDKHYALPIERLRSLKEGLITTLPVATETCNLLLSRHGTGSQRSFVESFSAAGMPRESPLSMESYADLPMDSGDASPVLLAEEPGHGRILPTDTRDFRTYRWKSHQPFENLR